MTQHHFPNSVNIPRYLFGSGSINGLGALLSKKRITEKDGVVFLVDHFFQQSNLIDQLPKEDQDLLIFIDTSHEPTTDGVDQLTQEIISASNPLPVAIVGMGGGSTLDTAKAIANLLTNGGQAANYQGWDLVKKPGIYKIGIPTISGTGAEASRTCVMTNYEKNLKLGMNSDFTLFDQLILDPNLTRSVPIDQYFYTGMDTYIHCIESLAGSTRHALADAFSTQALALCKKVFATGNMQSDERREQLMVASYLGGTALANSMVGVVHPFSAGLSIVMGTHHCIANCIVMQQMGAFYPEETAQFQHYLEQQQIELPQQYTAQCTDADFDRMYESTVIHEKPLTNALGEDFQQVLTKEKVIGIFKKM